MAGITAKEVWRYYETDGVPSSDPHVTKKSDMQAWGTDIEERIDAANNGFRQFETWALLNAAPGTAVGQAGRVTGPDAGTHTDPVVGGTVNNKGNYRWSTAPAGWKRVGDLVDDVAVAALQADVDAASTGYPSLGDRLDANETEIAIAIANKYRATYETLKTMLNGHAQGIACILDNGTPAILVKDLGTLTNNYLGPAASKISTTRATAAWFFDENGLLVSAAAGVPRFGFTDVDRHGSPGLIDEPAATNIVLWNRDLTNAAWTKANITPAKNQVGLDGIANSASSITATATNGTVLQAITLANSTRFQSAYVKRLVGTGAIEMTTDGGSTWTAIATTSKWSRFKIPVQTLANPSVGFRIATSGDSIAVDLVQNENNASAATTPIVTTTASVTRNVDLFSIDLSALPWDATKAAVYAEGMSDLPNGITSRVLFQIDDGTNNNRFFGALSVTQATAFANSGGVTQASVSVGAVVPMARQRMAMAWQSNSLNAAFDGALGALDTAVILPSVTTLRFGGAVSGGSALYGALAKFVMVPERLSDTVLQEYSLNGWPDGSGAVAAQVADLETRVSAIEGSDTLSGLKTSFLGDSLTIGLFWTAPFLALSGVDAENLAVSGQSFSSSSSLGGQGIYNQVTLISSDRKWLIIQGGTNDFAGGSDLGVLGDTALTTFAGAVYRTIVDGMTEAPAARVLLLIPHASDSRFHTPTHEQGVANVNGDFLYEFQDMMRRVAEFCGADWLDYGALTGINQFTATVNTSDGLHFNATGGPKVAKAVYQRGLLLARSGMFD
ncbi:SGNH/GDSL hydrolase family protein [Mesorhizobium sp. YC-39]|uniref:SGNH/GDSL hydrolase family protein n=1 Tax=unclassified Mesorhizobium TaxID=325217 RepID=UPI0021E98AC5|nr:MULTISPECIES: SGNH/GDSL hydrolase family protein [unclassified Mesorhizobium]MCV3209596.1 SGNH/GDSL hydrolase family protein [Mesorhizobium sp. YC-2]MCV3230126.1 SGNH/GDSL hydrolase family protein [Mesorhizobium sp. YC-39]